MKKTIIFMIVGLLASSACIAQQNTEEMTLKSLQDQPSWSSGFEKGKNYYNAKSPEEKSKLYSDIYKLYSNLEDDVVFKLYVHGVETGSKYTFPWASTSMGEHRRPPTIDWYNEGVLAGKYYIQKALTEEFIIRIYNGLNSFEKMLYKRGLLKGSQNQFPPWKVSAKVSSKLYSGKGDYLIEMKQKAYREGFTDGQEYVKNQNKYNDILFHHHQFKLLPKEVQDAYKNGVIEGSQNQFLPWKVSAEEYSKLSSANNGLENNETSESYNQGLKDGQEYAICYKEYITEKKKISTLYLKEDLIKRFYRKLAKNPNDYREGVIKGLEETPFAW